MHPNDGRVVSNFIVQALRGDDITLYGDGSQTRAFCYVDDMVDGLIRMMATPADLTGPINLGNPHEIAVSELAQIILRLTGSKSRLVFRPLPKDDPTNVAPTSASPAPTSTGSRRSAETGLRRTIDYFCSTLAA